MSEGERAARKAGLVFVILALLAVPAWRWGVPAWRHWQQGQALKQVKTFSTANDHRSAMLALRRAIELGPGDPTTWREAVRLLGEVGSPDVLAAHQQLARLVPDDPAVKLAWVRDALRFDRTEEAARVLATLQESATRDAAFYRVAAALATALGRMGEVEANLEHVVAQAPDDAMAAFNLAAVRVWSDDEAKRDAARAALTQMVGREPVGVRAALELLKHAARTHDEQLRREIVAKLQEKYIPGWRADRPEEGAAGVIRLIEYLKPAAAKEGAASVASLARWLADAGQPREALLWLETLPTEIVSAREVADVAAALSAELGDLDRVETYLRGGAWGQWPRDVLTLAMAARLQRVRYGPTTARATWESALQAANGSLPALRALVRLADAWNDEEAAERALHVVTERYPTSSWAYEALRTKYASRGELQKLWQVYAQWMLHDREAPDLVASWIVLGAVLDRLDAAAVARAEAEFGRADRKPAAVVALAAVRWRQGRPAETLELLQLLPPETRNGAAASFWKALAAADLGNRDTVEAALGRATRAGMSSEEAALLRQAASKVKLGGKFG